MKTSLLLLSLLTFGFSNLFGHSTEIKKVKYARTEIEVPADYNAKDEYSIESNLFSAQWLYLTKGMVGRNEDKLGEHKKFKTREYSVNYT